MPLSLSDLRRKFIGLALIAACTVMACDDDDLGPVDAAADASVDGARADAADAGLQPDADGGLGGGSIAANRPVTRPFAPALVDQLRLPPGFRISVFASGLGNPRMVAAAPDGSVYVTLRDQSQVVRLRDADGDGDASDPTERTTVASATSNPALAGVHGLALAGGKMYLATVKAVLAAPLDSVTGQLGAFVTLLNDLPDGGQHPNRTLAVGPDGKLYVTVGSTCNACGESNPEHATVLRVNVDGTATENPANPAHPMLARNPQSQMSPRVFASGLRNTLGFAWHPSTGDLWGSDHGSDGLGNDIPPDEINRIDGGKSYGWPFCYGTRDIDTIIEDPSKTVTKAQYCPTTTPSTAGYPAHSAPIGFVFYGGGQFPASYDGDAFVALRGSWNREVPTGYKVVRVHFQNGLPAAPAGRTSPVEDFVSGFLIENGQAHFGRLAGLAVDRSGALLIAEDTNGVVYRVTYAGSDGRDGGTADGNADGSSDAEVGSPTDAGSDAGG